MREKINLTLISHNLTKSHKIKEMQRQNLSVLVVTIGSVDTYTTRKRHCRHVDWQQ